MTDYNRLSPRLEEYKHISNQGFILPSWVDELGLDIYSFRVYVHLYASGIQDNFQGRCNSLETISKKCCMAVTTVSEALKKLVELGIVQKYNLRPQDVVEILMSKKISQKLSLSIALKTCEWCKGETVALQQHHYPLPRRLNGKTVVNICANCHFEFHQLVDVGFYKVVGGDRNV